MSGAPDPRMNDGHDLAAAGTGTRLAHIARDPRAQHGFVNEQRPEAHNRICAEQAWERSLDFWKRHL